MEGTQSLQFFSILGPNLALVYQNITKNQNFHKNCILRNIKQCKTQVSEKSKNSCKIKQKRKFFFGPKLGLNCPLWLRQRVIRNSHIVNNRTFWMPSSSFFVYSVLEFWLWDPIVPILVSFGAITPVNNIRLS